MKGDLLVVTALKDELDCARAPHGVRVVYCGVGKVNAAIATMTAVADAKPALVVNYGTAGKIAPHRRGLLEVARVIQRDMMTEPLAPRGVTPFSDEPHALLSGCGDAVCGTGDSFVTTTDPWLADSGVDIVDMELFAIAHVCHRFQVPWRAFKFITDDANDFAAHEWTANVASGEQLFWEALGAIIAGRRGAAL